MLLVQRDQFAAVSDRDCRVYGIGTAQDLVCCKSGCRCGECQVKGDPSHEREGGQLLRERSCECGIPARTSDRGRDLNSQQRGDNNRSVRRRDGIKKQAALCALWFGCRIRIYSHTGIDCEHRMCLL